MRLMSFALTTEQIRSRTKTVTRRTGWKNLQPGTLLQPIVKGQGIPKGGKVEKIGGPIKVVDVRVEQLALLLTKPSYGREELRREGFAHLTRPQFVDMFCRSHGCDVNTRVTRVEFTYDICVECGIDLPTRGLCAECSCEDDGL